MKKLFIMTVIMLSACGGNSNNVIDQGNTDTNVTNNIPKTENNRFGNAKFGSSKFSK